MKTIKSFYLILIFLSPNIWAERVDTNKPIILTDVQMDNVTAGRLNLSVTALAFALGSNTVADTDTHTSVFDLGDVEIGFGVGRAFACCGSDSDTAVLIESSADGRFVFTSRQGFVANTAQSSYTMGMIFVLSTNNPEALNRINGF